MKVELKGNVCIVTREKGDPKFRNTGYGANGNQGESKLLYHVKKILIARGYDLIKKRVQKDNHLMGDQYQQYIRTRKPSGESHKDIYIFNHNYAIRGAEVGFNEDGIVHLTVWYDVFNGSIK